MNDSSAKRFLLIILFAIVAVIVFGAFSYFFFGPKTSEIPVGFGWYLFSFVAGLTMIVLPCTLPLAFVIVPLSMGKGPIKGLTIALAFGIGVTITLSLYGVLAAIIGKVAIGSLGAPLEVVKNWMYLVAGVFAYLFALGELGLVKFRMPSYTGAFPGFIQKQQDVLKALLLGLFLGNIGVGCPHPATPMILTRIATSGDVFYGWLLFLVHAVGRVLPLLFLAILGIIGVNALQGLVARKDKIERATGWGMVFVAAFILALGLFSHDWWVWSGTHSLLEEITHEEYFLGAAGHSHGMPAAGLKGLFGLPIEWGTWFLLALWLLPLWWSFLKRRNAAKALAEADKQTEQKVLKPVLWNVLMLSVLLVLLFGYTIPHRFAEKSAMPHDDHGAGTTHTDGHDDHATMPGMSGHEGHGLTMTHDAATITEGLSVNMSASPVAPFAGGATTLDFFVNTKPQGTPVPVNTLDTMHEKKMHVVGMRKDLTQFFHIHPSEGQAGHMLANYTFPQPGEYKIWTEVTEAGMTHAIAQPILTVGGQGAPYTAPVKDTLNTRKIVNGKQVELHHEALYVNGTNHLSFTVLDSDGNNVILDNYLGAKMHLSIVSEDLNRYIHTHPSEEGMDESQPHSHTGALISQAFADEGHDHGAGGVGFDVVFPAPGYYKLFAQFKPQGVQGVADDYYELGEFWVQVQEGSVPSSVQLTWWTKLWISLGLMIILSWIIHRYIHAPERAPLVQK